MTTKRTQTDRPVKLSEPATLVGRIVDPLVRDDGLGEPAESVASAVESTDRNDFFAAREESSQVSPHPVRDRLLAKAAQAQAVREQSPTASTPMENPPAQDERGALGSSFEESSDDVELQPSEEDEASKGLFGFKSLHGLTDDLDSIGRQPQQEPGTPSDPSVPRPNGLLTSTVWGVVGFAALFAFLVQGVPRQVLTLPKAAVPAAPSQVEGPQPEPQTSEPGIAPVIPSPQKVSDEALSVDTVVHPPRNRQKGPWRIEQAQLSPQMRVIRAPVGKESFLGATQTAGVPLGQAYRVIKAFEGVRNFDRCRPRHEFVALLDRASGKLDAFEYIVSEEEIYQARTGDDGLLHGELVDLQIRRQRARGVITLRGGFEASAARGGFEAGLARVVNKALAGYTTTNRMKSGDVLALIAQEVTVLGDFSRYAGVEALEYRRIGEKPLRIYYQDAGKTRGYVDAKGRMFGMGRWAKPVKGAVRTSKFNPRRMHPILKRIKPHNGTDFAAAPGTPVMAAANAKVKFAGKLGPNGNFVRLSHSGGYETGYSHLLRFAKGLRAGQRVKQHQVIGYVGSTGRSTGPHLHFSAKKNGRFIDPESLDLDAFAKLPVSDRKQLSKLRRRYDELLSLLEIPKAVHIEEAEVTVAILSAAPSEPAVAPPSVPFAGAPMMSPAQTSLGASTFSQSPAGVAPVTSASSPPLSIYLTDMELMQQQSKTHSGEVDSSSLREQ